MLADAATSDGTRFVHEASCQVRPEDDGVTPLGSVKTCAAAMEAARRTTDRVDGCALCCPDCHTMRGND